MNTALKGIIICAAVACAANLLAQTNQAPNPPLNRSSKKLSPRYITPPPKPTNHLTLTNIQAAFRTNRWTAEDISDLGWGQSAALTTNFVPYKLDAGEMKALLQSLNAGEAGECIAVLSGKAAKTKPGVLVKVVISDGPYGLYSEHTAIFWKELHGEWQRLALITKRY